jgi:hypothetical protein
LKLGPFQTSCFNLKNTEYGKLAILQQAFCFDQNKMTKNVLYMCQFNNTHSSQTLGHQIGVFVNKTLESICMMGQGETQKAKIWIQDLPGTMQERYSLDHNI